MYLRLSGDKELNGPVLTHFWDWSLFCIICDCGICMINAQSSVAIQMDVGKQWNLLVGSVGTVDQFMSNIWFYIGILVGLDALKELSSIKSLIQVAPK